MVKKAKKTKAPSKKAENTPVDIQDVSGDIALIDREVKKLLCANKDQAGLYAKRGRMICEYLRTKSILIRDHELGARVSLLETAMRNMGQTETGAAQESDFE